ncbi:hypothetical protein F4818DRAFT_446526 [Hypoxylon cercidicola]|nr:hypothetical protein F4818DRAFT_446526 [Hypoxylon cercidicola]
MIDSEAPRTNDGDKVRIAIIGGGIVGVVTALGLLKRNINVELYEQAGSLREIGAGLAFTTNAQRCMELLDPKILAALKAVSTRNLIPHYIYVDGFHCESDAPNDISEKELFQVYAGDTGFDSCHRAHFLDELWAVFDTYDHPAPAFSVGRVCIAGDAAHASSPHLGASAGFGVEDALALGTVMEQAATTLRAGGAAKDVVLSAAFRAYDTVRRERAQWLVRSSRQVCKTYEWANPDCGDDPDKCLKDIERRAHKIWYFDIDGMVRDAESAYHKFMQV